MQSFAKALRKLASFSEDAELVLVGGLAVSLYGFSRFTQDMDFCLLCKDAGSLRKKLERLGKVEVFSADGTFARISVEGTRADLMLIPEELVEESLLFRNVFDRCLKKALPVIGVQLPVAAPEELLSLKVLSGRHKDFLDIRWLLENCSMDVALLKQELDEVLSWKPETWADLERFLPELVQLVWSETDPGNQTREKQRRK